MVVIVVQYQEIKITPSLRKTHKDLINKIGTQTDENTLGNQMQQKHPQKRITSDNEDEVGDKNNDKVNNTILIRRITFKGNQWKL